MKQGKGCFIEFIEFFIELHRVLPRECTGRSKHPLAITQDVHVYTWASPDGQYRNQIDYIFAGKDGEALYSLQKQDRELTVAQTMNSLLPNSELKLKKVGKTTRPFRYDLNQIPYNYTVGVKNRYKGIRSDRQSA